jgi:GT2 family glycosyltransferase
MGFTCDIRRRIVRNHSAKVDIILLSFNGLDISKTFLNCLYENTSEADFNLIWIDNGSTDGTPCFLQEFSANRHNMALVLNEKNAGVIDGRNQGFAMLQELLAVQSEYIICLDNDQFVREDWLEHHFKVLQRGYDLVGVEAWQMSRTFLPIRKIERVGEWFNYVGCGGCLISRKVTDKIGLYDPRFNPSYFEDPDFCFSAVEAGFKIGWNDKAKITHLPHQTLGKLGAEKEKRFISSLTKLFGFNNLIIFSSV